MEKKNLIISLILILILSFSALNVMAAEDLELNQAVKELLERNRTLKNARKDIENAEKDIDLTVRSYFPTLDLQSSYTKMDEGPQRPILGGYGPDENYQTSVSLTQPLWLGGKVGLEKEMKAYGLEISRTDYEKTVEDQIFNLVEAYYGVLTAEGMVVIRKEALDTANEHLRTVKNNLEAGVAIRRDLLQSQIEQRNAEENLTSARNDLKIARRRLAQLLNSEAEYRVYNPNSEFDFSLEQKKLFQTAIENDSQLLILELNKEIVKLQQKLAGQYYRPNVSLNGSYDWQGDEFMDEDSWSMTLGVNVPLYDGGKGGIKADQEENELEKIANNRLDLLENLNIEVEESILTVKESKEKIELEKLSLENAEENLEIANKSYEAGVASNTDVIDAQSTYNQSKISLLQSEYSYDVEQFRTLYKIGRLKEYFGDVINDENNEK